MSYSKIGEWSGLDLFKCDDCRFQTVSIPQRDRHDLEGHPRERAPEVKILDPDGQPFESIPVSDAPEREENRNVEVDVKVPKGLAGLIGDDLENYAREEARKEERPEEDGEQTKPSWWRRSSQDKEQSK